MRRVPQDPLKRDYNLSLSGCGFLGMYHVGVISAFHEYARDICVGKIAGASAGSLAAACLICDVSFGEATTSILRLAVQARRRALGPFHPGFDISTMLYDIFLRILPDNAHELCTGRLHISVTRVSDGANVLLNRFTSKEELVTSLMCSCFIPFYCGLVPPKVNGVAYMDGGFSDNLPLLNENTITVSPFSGENDICPSDESFNLMMINLSNTSIAVSPANIYRIVRILFPPHPEILARMTQQGFDDAVKYLQQHNLISCTRCLAVTSSFEMTPVEETKPASHPYDGCDDCKLQKQMADVASLPEPIRRPILDAADSENQGLINWLFRHRPVKILSILTLPYVLPFDITVAVAAKVAKVIPQIHKEVSNSLYSFLSKLRQLVVSEETWRSQISSHSSPISDTANTTFSCNLAITEFNYNVNDEKSKPRSRSLEDLQQRVGPRVTLTDAQKRRQQRKSYAGIPYEKRVLSEMSLGSKLQLNQTLGRTRKTSVMDALRSLDRDRPSVSSAIEITNDVLDHERGSLQKAQAQSLEQILDVTKKQEALMAFYYTDENNRVNVTEIFDVSDNNLQAHAPERAATQEASRRRKRPVF